MLQLHLWALNANVLDYFSPFLNFSEQEISFAYRKNFDLYPQEISERHSLSFSRVPTTDCLWEAAYASPISINRCYIFQSAIEALYYAHFIELKQYHRIAFLSLGNLPNRKQILDIRQAYPHAQVITVFSKTLLGAVADCRVALWASNREGTFHLKEERIKVITDRNVTHTFYGTQLSLSRFERISGIRSGNRTIKPKGHYLSFMQQYIAAKLKTDNGNPKSQKLF